MDYLQILRCPVTFNELNLIRREDFKKHNLPSGFEQFGNLNEGLIDRSGKYFYPVFDGIIILLQEYAFYTGSGNDTRESMSFDKKRVFDYYNEISFKTRDTLKIYGDAQKWLDFRPVARDYIKNSLSKASGFIPGRGKYLLDIASGPVGLQEYLDLSSGYDYRICIDLSVNALIQAKINLEKAGQKGIFICGDITKIPLKDNSCSVVLCQHTLYHVPKNEQSVAVNEMFRVAMPGTKIIIVYSWFYYSWMMNISLNIIQLYRILRYLSGRLNVKIFKSKPRLYFYAHGPRWFKKSFSFSRNIEIFCWRSTNKYFLRTYIHKWFFGNRILKKLSKLEDKYSRKLGLLGEYPIIVISKN